MAVKKTQLYKSLWDSCDELRGGMDASQYKDYILTLLFMKYVTDKFKGQPYSDLQVFDKAHDPNPDPEKRTGCSFDDFVALKNNKNIGDGMDKIIARLAEVNESLKGVIDIAHFNDEQKIGVGQEMVDKLTKLIAIFQRPELNFTHNRAEGDDIIGDAYEYLMRNFASESGKSKGQFYTPAEVSRILSKVIGIDRCKSHDASICDPCCGTGGFLISGMHRMLRTASSEQQRKDIKSKQIHGIEIRDDMFSIATTNMILRGDGQSNLVCTDFLAQNPGDIQLKGVTVGFMNPPYSQAKTKETAHLSELSFIRRLLSCVCEGGKVAVIVPVSAMIGKTKDDKEVKEDIYKHHTLEGVITLNKQTFYGVGTNPCIAVFTAGEPHPADKKAKFINFEDDGFEVKMHLGLVETERAKDRRQYLLDCWRGCTADYPSSFMVESTVEATDEWLHSFYYYNDEMPTEQDFLTTIADYLTFEFNMVTHGRGYLFEQKEG